MRQNGPGIEVHPLLIKEQPDGSAKVIGGKMNHLRLTGVRPKRDYKEHVAANAAARREERKRQTPQAPSGVAERWYERPPSAQDSAG